MNPLRALVAVPLLATALAAQTDAGAPLPDRPAVALSRYKDAWVPVVGVEGGAPVALDNSGRVTLPPDSGIALSVGSRFADGFVTVGQAHFTDVPSTTDPDTAEAMAFDMKSGVQTFEADLTADAEVPGAYALFVRTQAPAKPEEAPRLMVISKPIGDLQPGRATHVSARLPKPPDGATDWNLLVFTAGRQVRTTGMGAVMPAYFDRMEAVALRRRIAEREEKHESAPLAVFREMPLGLPDTVEAKYRGETVKVRVAVNADGQVTSATPVGVDDPGLSAALGRGFGTWLFVPKVKDGAPEPASAIVPLKM
jgi:hypothetical protein